MPKYKRSGPRMTRWLERRAEAEERQRVWETLTLNEQLNSLDERLGKGVGAVKQRLRIKAHLMLNKPKFKNNELKQYTNPKKQRHQRRKTKSKKRSFDQN